MTGARATLWRRFSETVAPSIRPHRLVLAFKTALAAGVAWVIGGLLPGVDEYSYYAPLGALIVMMPTLMSSLRSTLQTILGLGLGVLLAWGVIFSPLPGVVSVALAVGFGVVLGGLAGLGAGRDYVPIAALFVLVLGGSDAEDFSLGYLLQMGTGMLAGLIVNAAVLPPLWVKESSASINDVRRRLADTLDDTAMRIRDGDDLAPCLERVEELDVALRAAESMAADAAESRHLNPRARRHPQTIDEDFDDILTLSRVVSQLRNLLEDTQSLAVPPDHSEGHHPLGSSLEATLRRLADLVRAWNAGRDGHDALRAARDAVSHLAQAERGRAAPRDDSLVPLVGPDARQMVALIERRLRR